MHPFNMSHEDLKREIMREVLLRRPQSRYIRDIQTHQYISIDETVAECDAFYKWIVG